MARGRRPRSRAAAWLAVFALALVLAAGWRLLAPSQAPASSGGLTVTDQAIEHARNLVDALPPANQGETPPYQRDEFGPAWADVDHNGCDTRNDVLRRDLADVETKPGTHGCVVLSGRLEDPFTGEEIDFVRGEKTSPLVQIDHLVPLAQAWRLGAWAWDTDRRTEFANALDELLAVKGAANQEKGDKGPSDWLPEVGTCAYVVRYLGVLEQWDLALPDADRHAAREVLANDCG